GATVSGWAWELVRLGGGSDRGGGRRGGDSCVGALSVRGGRGASAVRPWYGRRAASTPADCEIRPLTGLDRRCTFPMPLAGADEQSRKASESVTAEGIRVPARSPTLPSRTFGADVAVPRVAGACGARYRLSAAMDSPAAAR